MGASGGRVDPNRGFPNPKIHDDLVDPDEEAAKQAADSAAAGPGAPPESGTGAGTSVPSQPAGSEF